MVGRIAAAWRRAEVDEDACSRIAEACGVPPAIARVLAARGIVDEDEARGFLRPSLAVLGEPEGIHGMAAATERILAAVRDGERIGIHGDYDVDGISSSALLVTFFEHLNVPVSVHLPDRISDGYGVRAPTIEKFAEEGAGLIVTVDGGSNDIDALRRARELGMDVIVTDHHPVHVDLSEIEWPVVHPGLGSPESLRDLAGVGVAYALVWALGRALSGRAQVDDAYRELMLRQLHFVALGTIADVVPLTRGNRVLVHYGLRAFREGRSAGLDALCQLRRIDPDRLRADDIGFRIAPLLNAAGRMGDAHRALDCLLCDDPAKAQAFAKELERANDDRRRVEQEMLEVCEEEIGDPGSTDRPILLASESFHPGVAGIVAARLVERYGVPSFVLSQKNGVARGSGRSLPGQSLEPFYDKGRGVAIGLGGHALAGGVTVEASRVSELRDVLQASVERSSGPAWSKYDAELSLAEVDPDFCRALVSLAPWGEANPTPRFRVSGLRIRGALRVMGRDESHLSFSLSELQPSGRDAAPIRCVWFGGAERASEVEKRRDELVFIVEVQMNTFRGRTTPELRIVELVDADI